MQDVDETFQRSWIRTHVEDAWATLCKPVCCFLLCFAARACFTLKTVAVRHWRIERYDCQDISVWICCEVEHPVTCVQLILEEFGKWLNSSVGATMEERNKYLSIVYNETQMLINTPGSTLKVPSCPYPCAASYGTRMQSHESLCSVRFTSMHSMCSQHLQTDDNTTTLNLGHLHLEH